VTGTWTSGKRRRLADGIVVRPGRGYDCPDYLRITLGPPHENAALLDALGRLLTL
jgi:histidinol-phosphate/aromatic aminotransferase/cobyric acid decarboxylase-like protein